ncbi:MAG TPA: class I SAM-dependent methyltransferase [Telluria sp.]|nr:class I SAM-dependent methyltransferase [Telluria sp.]
MADTQLIQWTENGQAHSARWHSESGWPAPRKVALADDTTPADAAFRLASEGTALLWRGDFQNARQMLQALARRADHKGRGKRAKAPKQPATLTEAFHLHRMAQAQRARILSMLLIPFEPGYRIPLRRAPDVAEACREAYGAADGTFVIALRELLGVIGAHEWRKNGVPIPALGGERIHPWYGVFSPIRGEYVDLVAQAPLPAGTRTAFDIGVGTGVLAAVLARRGIQRVTGTDQDERALGCARANIARLGLEDRVDVVAADLFPPGRADLVVCNPPWLPGRPSASIEGAVYDPDSRMLNGFLGGLKDHLEPHGEGWLILSDFAEHLGLRTREQLLAWIADAGLVVTGRHDVRPVHGKARDAADPLHAARAAEVTSLWRLAAAA